MLTVCLELLRTAVKVELDVVHRSSPLSGRMSWFEIKQQGRMVWSETQVGTVEAAAKCAKGLAAHMSRRIKRRWRERLQPKATCVSPQHDPNSPGYLIVVVDL